MNTVSTISSYDSTYKIFKEYLEKVKEIKFTHREIDVAVCIIHNRTEKKISEILGIMPKTVNVYVTNLTQKLRCNSRQYIIDFFEKSGYLLVMQQYYIHLLIESEFIKYLKIIGSKINQSKTDYIVNQIEISFKQKYFIKKLTQHLNTANIRLAIKSDINNINDLDMLHEQAEGKSYYLWALQLIKSFLDKNEIDHIIKEFKKDYQLLLSYYEKKEHNQQKFLSFFSLIYTKQLFSKKNLFLLSVIIIVVSCLSYVLTKQVTQEKPATPSSISDVLSKFFANFSVRNLTKEEAEQNYSIIKQFDFILELIESGKIEHHFDITTLASEEFINCIYNLNATASYVLFKEHDALKAEKILKYAKTSAETFVAKRSKLKIDFDKLNPAEIYTELAVIRDLPEMYNITIYFLGRSNIYQKNIHLAEKYFELARYLGDKLGLFEGPLSLINGLAITKTDQLDIDIRQGNHDLARKLIKECINIYETVREDKAVYKLNYRPYNFKPTTIIPKDDIHNIIDCSKRIIKLITKLLDITNKKKEIDQHLKLVSKHLKGQASFPGTLDILFYPKNELTRIAADSYNTIGYFLLKLYDKKIDFTQLRELIIIKLNFRERNDLEVIYQLFDLSKSLSRNTEFSKADSYDGLIKVYQRMINQDNISELDKKELLTKIHEFKTARNIINKELKR